MSRNGSGVYSRVSPPGSGGYVSGDIIDPSIVNNEIDDIGDEITNSIDKGGRTTPTANLPMGGFRHTGVGNGSARNDYASVAQVQDGGILSGTATGTTGTYTMTLTPAITAYADGQRFRVKWTLGDATVPSTLNINGVGAKGIRKVLNGSQASLATNDIRSGAWADVVYDSTSDKFILQLVYHDFILPKVVAVVSATGILLTGYNVSSVTKNGIGDYTLNIIDGTGMAIGLSACVMLSINNGAGTAVTVSSSSINILTYDVYNSVANTPRDLLFKVMAF